MVKYNYLSKIFFKKPKKTQQHPPKNTTDPLTGFCDDDGPQFVLERGDGQQRALLGIDGDAVVDRDQPPSTLFFV